MDSPDSKPKPFFQHGPIKFTYMKAPFAWFETFRLDPPSKKDKTSVQVARSSDRAETDGTVVTVQEPVEVFGAVPEAKKALRSSWIWNLRPGGFRPRALILAEPVDHSAQGIARFELESKRWAAGFSQTVYFEPGKTRKGTYEHTDAANNPDITITTRTNVPWVADADSDQLEELPTFKAKPAPEKPPIISGMKDSVAHGDASLTGVTGAWAKEVEALVWEGSPGGQRAEGQPIPYDPHKGGDDDEPGPSFYYDLTPFATTDPETALFKGYKLKAASGREDFKTWLVLYRSRLEEGADADLDRKLNDSDMDPVSETVDFRVLPCVVPVASFYWKASYGAEFYYNRSSEYPFATEKRGAYYVSPAESFDGNRNWREFDLIKEPTMFYELPDMSGTDAWKIFPEIRYDAEASEYLYSYVEKETQPPQTIDYYKEDQEDDEWLVQPRPLPGRDWVFVNGPQAITDKSALSPKDPKGNLS